MLNDHVQLLYVADTVHQPTDDGSLIIKVLWIIDIGCNDLYAKSHVRRFRHFAHLRDVFTLEEQNK